MDCHFVPPSWLQTLLDSFLSNLKNYQVMFGVIIAKFKCLWKDGRCTVYFLSKESIAEIGDKCQSGFHTGPSFLPTRNVSRCPVPVTWNARHLKSKVLFFIFIQDKRFVSSESIPLIDTALFGGQTGVLFSLFFTNVLIVMLRINVFDPGIQGI